MTRIFLESLRKGRLSRAVKASSAGPEYEKAGEELRALIARHFGRSLQIREVDAGSCGACESVFFFKQKTAYEMVMSDWSSDVCSSDLMIRRPPRSTR